MTLDPHKIPKKSMDNMFWTCPEKKFHSRFKIGFTKAVSVIIFILDYPECYWIIILEKAILSIEYIEPLIQVVQGSSISLQDFCIRDD
jgi:hypothetical protein